MKTINQISVITSKLQLYFIFVTKHLSIMMNSRVLQGFLAIAPLVLTIGLLVVYFWFILSFIISSSANSDKSDISIYGLFGIIVVGAFLLLFSFLSFIYFLIHAAKNQNLNENNLRLIWILTIRLTGVLGCLAYWIVEIQIKEPKPIIT